MNEVELQNARTEDMNGFQQEGFGPMDMTVTYLGMVGIGLRMLRVTTPVLSEAVKAWWQESEHMGVLFATFDAPRVTRGEKSSEVFEELDEN